LAGNDTHSNGADNCFRKFPRSAKKFCAVTDKLTSLFGSEYTIADPPGAKAQKFGVQTQAVQVLIERNKISAACNGR
jgi:hypothetical protein